MTLLLSNEDVEKALTPEKRSPPPSRSIENWPKASRSIARAARCTCPPSRRTIRASSIDSNRRKAEARTGVWALRVTSDMAGHSFTAGVKRRRILPVATGNRYCGLVILFDIERIEPVAIMPDGVIQKMRVAALSAVGAKYLAPKKPKVWVCSEAAGKPARIWSFCARCSTSSGSECLARIPNTAASLRRHEQEARAPSRCSRTATEAVDGSDFIQAATAAWDPVFDGHWVEKGMYVASIGGSDASNKRREIDDETIRRADLYIVHSKEVAQLDKSPDIWEAAEKGIKSWDSIHEIQDLLAGNVRWPHARGSDHGVQQQHRCRNAVRGARVGCFEASSRNGAGEGASDGVVSGGRVAVGDPAGHGAQEEQRLIAAN